MRITQGMLHDDALRNLQTNYAGLARVQEQASTGRRLNRPSDDPAQVRSAIKLHSSLAELKQYLRNADLADRSLSAAESALGGAGDVVIRAIELATQGANDTLSAADRQHIADEVNQLAAGLVELAGTRSGDAYVFSGLKTDTKPFTSPTGAYQGDTGAILARIGPGVTLQTNVTADTTFGPALQAVAQLAAELSAGTRVSSTTIAALHAGQDALLSGRAKLGAVQNRLTDTKTFLDDNVFAATKLLSDLEDADMDEVISEVAERQTVYEAALKVNARILQRSLMDEI